MSNWADLLDEPDGPIPARIEPAGQLVPDEPVVVNLLENTWRLDGPEPPPYVIRLGLVRPDEGYQLSSDPLLQLVRVPRGPRGEHRGWWWTRPDEVPAEPEGWQWNAPPTPRRQYDLVQVQPLIVDTSSTFTESLVRALPYDGNWYQIGVGRRGTPVWAWIEAHDDWDAVSGDEKPDE